MDPNSRNLLKSTISWSVFWTVALFSFVIFGLRPLLYVLGLIFELMGGTGFDEADPNS
ncbi:hypothetical protein [Sphingomonas sp.]|uniref:hypothetical protein n=1 Tax=Sphingomonas sp. TaxID=28214 RepID=UPI0025CBA9D3|nr:hypothetical protein [Sphingomonas sp.]MBV9527206.1 hypothetical protein [Sphingomonas sp.]